MEICYLKLISLYGDRAYFISFDLLNPFKPITNSVTYWIQRSLLSRRPRAEMYNINRFSGTALIA